MTGQSRKDRLWECLISFENLYHAANQARKGKRTRTSVLRFEQDRERNLWALHDELANRTYRPGGFFAFEIRDPKPRLISAAPYRDRVVHHALCNVIQPIFERSFIFDSYANRVGKGTHAAVRRARAYARKFPYVLQCDIAKYFPSIDHQVLKSIVRRKLRAPGVLWLTDLIIDHSNEQDRVTRWFPGDDLFTPLERRRGLPIGNQTSQFFANLYLDPLDHLIKDEWGCRGYVRYVDDFLIFGEDKRSLKEFKRRIERALEPLRLVLHADKSEIFPTRTGIPFLGYRIFPHRVLLDARNVRAFRSRLDQMRWRALKGELTPKDVTRRIQSWIAHALHADTYRLRKAILGSSRFVFRGSSADPPRGAWR